MMTLLISIQDFFWLAGCIFAWKWHVVCPSIACFLPEWGGGRYRPPLPSSPCMPMKLLNVWFLACFVWFCLVCYFNFHTNNHTCLHYFSSSSKFSLYICTACKFKLLSPFILSIKIQCQFCSLFFICWCVSCLSGFTVPLALPSLLMLPFPKLYHTYSSDPCSLFKSYFKKIF